MSEQAGASASVVYAAQSNLNLNWRRIAAGLDKPLFLTAPPGDDRLFVVEQTGRILILKNGTPLATPFLDLGNRISSGGERGLLSMAFDPRYANNGHFYVYYTDPQGDIAIHRFTVAAGNPDLANPASDLPILTIPHPVYTNHNGGLLAFGPDGMLYIGSGDGGGAGDPNNQAQNLNSLLGKLLRLDVGAASVAAPYAIPRDNPYLNQPGRRAEIWAHGLRNPWRYAFDDKRLYIADVGQARREEVNVANSNAGGLNYGWNRTEGNLCYGGDPCDKSNLTLPVHEYDHDNGCSITGGYVYRGQAIPELRGRYFYSDYCGGWLKSLVYRTTVGERVDWPVNAVGPIVSFGEDGQRELYALSSDGGSVYRLERR
ncbi:PQQ-dependent sugar dehydrogenase [Chitinimonas arctica]|uniref:PQQ-dependent sugar dehydrogenase n=1 Tax=Chitinimonas arctica TaxID=2594795 RepID=A0A516SME0_9NEIS|nr:PQQ-dependent sugar dehydrogenase [Chitinimonas arctica]